MPAKLLLREALVQRRLFTATIAGTNVHFRSFTSDLVIANSWLRNDLDDRYGCADSFDGVIVGAGGHIGMAAITFAKRFPEKLVVTLEPSADNFRLLEENTKPYQKKIVRIYRGTKNGAHHKFAFTRW